jgi:hypothetical protein
MKDRLVSLLFWVLVFHLAVSAIFIFAPPFLKTTRLPEFYKVYLLPGPFFTDSRIVDNYSFSLSWNISGRWSSAISPIKEDFSQYHSSSILLISIEVDWAVNYD